MPRLRPNSKPVLPLPTPAAAPPRQTPALPIPGRSDYDLIETSQQHFLAGERELKVGHLERARAEFDRAVDVLLESPYGARTERGCASISIGWSIASTRYEVTALAQGDGFAEKKYEPASIDELLKIATFPKPAADAATTKAVKADLPRPSTTCRFRRTTRAGVRRAVPGTAARLHPGEPDARHRSTCR